VGEYTFAIFAVTAIALVLSWVVAVIFVPYLGVKLLKVKAHTGPCARGVRRAVLHPLPRPGELVRAAPLDHHRR
jgi:multidrug efflux pump subunit AcrB